MNSGLIFRFLVYSAFVYVCLSLPTSRKSGKQLVIAHRGASGYLPEHTHEAKVASFIMGADYLEQDVVLTKDFVPIVSHDIHLDEVTNVAQMFPERKRADGRYYAIDFTFEEIKQLEVSERFHFDNNQNAYFPLRFPLWKSHFSISSLQEEIELIQGMEASFGNIYKLDKKGDLTKGLVRKAGIYPEIKDPEFHHQEGKGNFSEIVLDLLTKYNYKTKDDAIFLQCFDPIELRRIHNDLKSNLKLVQLMPADFPASSEINWNSVSNLKLIAEFADGIGPEFSMLINTTIFAQSGTIVPSDFYLEAKRLGLQIHPYTARIDQVPAGIKDFDTLLSILYDQLNVDGVFTDFPDLTIQFLNNRNSNGAERATINFSLFIFALLGLMFNLA